MTKIFLIVALWSPAFFWAKYVSSTDGRTPLGEASTIEWAVFWALAFAPYSVLTKIKKWGD